MRSIKQALRKLFLEDKQLLEAYKEIALLNKQNGPGNFSKIDWEKVIQHLGDLGLL